MAQRTSDNNRPYDYKTMDDVIADLTELYSLANTTSTKVIRGRITQTGTTAPSLSILQNDTNITFTTSYGDVGNYFINFSENIDASNAYWSLTPYQTIPNFGMAVTNSGIELLVAYPDGAGDAVSIDAQMNGVPFEVILYNQ